MRSTRLAFVMFAMVVGSATLSLAADDRPNAHTVEKQPFPPADDRKVDVDFPIAHKHLDGLPEELGYDRIYALDSQLGPVQRWRRLLADHHVDIGRYQYVAAGDDDLGAVLISLFQGRVVRLGYFYPHLTKEKFDSLMHEVSDNSDGFQAKRGRFTASVGGVSIDGGGALLPSGVISMRKPSVVFDIGIDTIAWYLVNHPDLAEPVVEGLRARRAAIGMTLDEANLAMGSDGKLVGESDGAKTYQWAKGHMQYGCSGGEGGDFSDAGPSYSVHVTDEVTDAIMVDGKIKSVGRAGD